MLLAASLLTLLAPLLVLIVTFAVLVGGALGGRRLLGSLRQRQMENVPTKISLKSLSRPSWRDPTLMETLVSPLTFRGFQNLGGYRVNELSGLGLQLLVHEDENAVATIYEHPKMGHWVDITSYFTDGTTICYSTTTAATVVRPGHVRVSMVGLNPGALFTRFKLDKPRKPTMPASRETAAALFAEGYADEANWRKANGKMPVPFAYAMKRSA
jgi:hypothetical protein